MAPGVLSGAIVKGRVVSDGNPIANVSVTDGYSVVRTDSKGRYKLDSHPDCRFIYISVPSGYLAEERDGTPIFYIPYSAEQKDYIFDIKKKGYDDTTHGFIVVADPQIWSGKEFKELSRAALDIKNTVKSHKGVEFHGIGCGDIVSNDHNFYGEYKRVMSSAGIPFYNCMGNHDMTIWGRSFETTPVNYNRSFGPEYYSYNAGNIHYIVLNNNFYVGRDYFYIGYLDERQFRWIEEDIKGLKEGSTVVVSLHIPTSCTPQDRAKFEYKNAGVTMANHKALYKILNRYNVHILSGHTHTAYNQQIEKNLFEHVTPALSGAWWQGPLCTDGTPNGYGVYIVKGDSLQWYYKSVGYSKDYQMRVYSGKDYKQFEGYVVANIWNYDPSWRVELYENGESVCEMEQFDAYDPDAKRMYSDTKKMDHKWIYPSLTNHMFRAKPTSFESNLEVVATDRFGNRYRSKLKGYDLLIVGGGTSGTAAAITAAREGISTLLAEEYDWLGGMLTSAGVSAVDGNYRLRGGIWGEFRDSLAARYGSEDALATGWVSRILFEPSVGNSIFQNMAAKEPALDINFKTKLISLERDAKSDRWIATLSSPQGIKTVYPKIVIDATELGDVAKIAGVKYEKGMDSKSLTGESIAPEKGNDIIQDLTYAMILKEYDRDMTMQMPQGYDPSLFACCCVNSRCVEPKEKHRMWSKEKMITYGKLPGNKYMINWPIEGNDYYVDMVDSSPKEREEQAARAKNHSLCFLYFLQTELGFNKFALADDEYATADKLPFIPYHRESRRVDGVVRFTLNHITDPFKQEKPLYRTAVGVGDYPVDQHHTRYSGWSELPNLYFHPIPSYGFPLGIVIPKEVEGLIVAEKSVSVTNIVNGTTRLQPVVLQIGESSAMLASVAIKEGKAIGDVSVREVQRGLLRKGGYLLPYLDLPQNHVNFKALQRVGVTGIIKGVGMNKGWENQTWFMSDSLMNMSLLLEGMEEVYPGRFSKKDIVWNANRENNSKMVSIEDLARIIWMVNREESQSTIAAFKREWSSLGLVDYSTQRALTRGECAVLIDRYLNPFGSIDVDIYGNFIKK